MPQTVQEESGNFPERSGRADRPRGAAARELAPKALSGQGMHACSAGEGVARPGGNLRAAQGQPIAYWFRKHAKSSTLSTGIVVDPSQLALGSPEAYWLRKQTKSRMFSTGAIVELSQLA